MYIYMIYTYMYFPDTFTGFNHIYIYIYINIYICTVKVVFTRIVSSYWWSRAGKWQIHYISQKRVSRSLCCIFICILNFNREKSKLHFCIWFYLFFSYSLTVCYFIFYIHFFKLREYYTPFLSYNWLLYII